MHVLITTLFQVIIKVISPEWGRNWVASVQIGKVWEVTCFDLLEDCGYLLNISSAIIQSHLQFHAHIREHQLLTRWFHRLGKTKLNKFG